DEGVDVLGGLWGVGGPADEVAPGDVEVVGQPDGDRHGSERLLDPAARAVVRGDGRGQPAGQHLHLVAGPQDAAGDRARVPPVVVVGVGLGPDDVLNGEPDVDEVPVAGHVQVLEVVQQ